MMSATGSRGAPFQVNPESATQPRATSACVDGNEAAARVAYTFSEVIPIYPITPSSPMAELADEWAAAGRPNLWGAVPEIIEMQSEAGAAGTLHGAVQGGAFATTFTSSQGLLLMVPNMFKIAGELTPCAMHVAARTIATHALSIFGDHSDVMHAAPPGGRCWLPAASKRLTISRPSLTLRRCAPACRSCTSSTASARPTRWTRSTSSTTPTCGRWWTTTPCWPTASAPCTPDAPSCAARHRTRTCSSRPARRSTRSMTPCPASSRRCSASSPPAAGADYGLVDYVGAPDADRVVVLMGSGSGAAAETVDALTAAGERVGLLTVRLYRPFPAEHFVRALPPTVRSIAVLDRTKEPGATGEPLLLDVIATLHEAMDSDAPPFERTPHVIGGRYGLSSKEFRPAHVKAVFDELARFDGTDDPPAKRRFTVGIHDDVTRLSLDADDGFRYSRPAGEVQAMFFGLGADGTVGANKASVKIIGEHTDLFAQGYFVYDSKKSGSVTVSHLRFGPEPIRSTYLVEDADFVACHQFGLLEKMPVLDRAKPGATLLINSPFGPVELWDRLPYEVQAQIREKDLAVWAIDAYRVAADNELGTRINTVMQPCFFALAGVIPADEAIDSHQGVRRARLRATGGDDRRAQLRGDRCLARRPRPRRHPVRGDVATTHRERPARRRAGLRHPGHGPDDGRRRRPPAGVGAPRRRHVPDRDGAVREAGHRPGHPDLGPRHLHRLRQVRHRLPPRHDPDEGVRAVGPRRCAAVVQVEGVPLQGHLRLSDDDPGRP